MARARKKPIPIAVVAGPTGAGKTTLINRLLRAPAFADTAVILNDFGKTELAGARVETAAGDYFAFGAGCVCCSVRGALTDGLENLLRDLDNGRLAAIARVIIEADSAADPAAILGAVARHPYLSLRFAPDGVIAVLAAAGADAVLAARADTVRQLAMADVIAATGGAVPGLAFLNPRAAIVDAATAPASAFTRHGAFDPATGDLAAWLGPDPIDPLSPLPGEAGRVRSFTVARARTIPLVALDRLLEYLAFLQGHNLIRVRGAVATSEEETVVVEGMGSFFYAPQVIDRPAGEAPATRFAVSARDLDRATFEGYLDAFLNEARIDTPDRAALTDNPLAIAGFSAREGR